MSEEKKIITVEVLVEAPREHVWLVWNAPEHITRWCFAQDDWHAPKAENDLRVGGKLKTRMEARDGSAGFDFEGTYTTVEENKKIEYVMDDGRKVGIEFTNEGDGTRVRETFDAETQNSLELQKNGWQAILDNFKKEAERSQ